MIRKFKDYIVNEETNPFNKVEMLILKMNELNFNGSIILERLETLKRRISMIHNESEKNIIKNSLKDIEDLCKSYQKDVSIAMNNMFIKNLQDIKKLLEN